MGSDVGQYWFCVSSRRYLCSSRRFRSSSRRMWDNIGFAFRLVATCVPLVASDRRVAECGTILVLRFVSRRFRSLSRRIGSVPMRLGSSRRSRTGSLQIVESPNVGQYWFCVPSRRYLCSSRRFRSSSRRMWDNIGFAFRQSSLQIVESPNRFRPHAFRIVTA